MSGNQETVADIIAEMRAKAKHFEDGSGLMVSESALALYLYPIADRIEAAAKREREALQKILSLTNSLDEDCGVDPVEIRDIARNALTKGE